jgi:hypothetical protein
MNFFFLILAIQKDKVVPAYFVPLYSTHVKTESKYGTICTRPHESRIGYHSLAFSIKM